MLILAGITLITGLGLVFLLPEGEFRLQLQDIYYPLVDLVTVLFMFQAAWITYQKDRRLGWAWGIFTAAQIAYLLADTIWSILEVGFHSNPFPSLADAFYILVYPLFLVGVILLPNRRFSVHQILDIAIVMLVAVLGFWNFLLGPIAIQGGNGPALDLILSLAYPVGDIALLWALLSLLYRRSPSQPDEPIIWLLAGLIVMIVTDCLVGYQNLTDTYVSGNLTDLGYVLSTILTGLAGVKQAELFSLRNETKHTAPRSGSLNDSEWLSYFPYIWIVVAVFFVLFSDRSQLMMTSIQLGIWAGLLCVLVILRQMFSLTENSRLNRELRRALDQSEAQAASLKETNEQLVAEKVERQLAEENLYEQERQFSELIQQMPFPITMMTGEMRITEVNRAFRNIFKIPADEAIPAEFHPIVQDFCIRKGLVEDFQVALTGQVVTIPEIEFDPQVDNSPAFPRYLPDHSFYEITFFPVFTKSGDVLRIATFWKDISLRKMEELNLERRFSELESLHAISQAGAVATSLDDLLNKATQIITDKLFPYHFCIALFDEETRLLNPHGSYRIRPGLYLTPFTLDQGIIGAVALTRSTRRTGNVATDPDYVQIDPEIKSELCVPMMVGDRLLGIIDVESAQPDAYSEADARLLNAIAGELGVAIEKIRLLEAERDRRKELEMLADISARMRMIQDYQDLLPTVLQRVMDLLNFQAATMVSRDSASGVMTFEFAFGEWEEMTGRHIPPGAGIAGKVALEGQVYVCQDTGNEPQVVWPAVFRRVKCAACLPLIANEQVIGLIYVGRSTPITPSDVHMMEAIADMASSSYHRARLNEQTERHVKHLTILRSIDQAILASPDLRVVLDILLAQITAHLGVDAASVLLYQPTTHTLVQTVHTGLRSHGFQNTVLRLGESHAGRVALERRVEVIPDLRQVDDDMTSRIRQTEEGFIGYAALPLIAKGEIKGVLQLFQRELVDVNQDWLDFLKALADQAAIAIDNAQLFDEQQRAAVHLSLAYDDTIDGWSRALDLRDRETEGHSQRVTECTLQLARRLGIGEDQIRHIRRGARLHDIGKMGIPDSILLKPGPLTEDEWALMRQHPTYAYHLLLPIQYLLPALDIPHCHHERWDGKGYPRGLKGEEIPLAARVFAVVDVWDALTSDRPYRPAWKREQAIQYIRENSGSHFDPKVVAAFIELLAKEDGL